MLDVAKPEILDCGDARLLGFYSPSPRPPRGLVVLLHGWEGSADSRYMLATGALAHRLGYDVFRLNFRDHGATHALNEGLFHSCRLDEVVAAVAGAAERHPAPRTVLIGYSLGGNFALRVAVRAGRAGLRLDRVIAVCPVLCPHSTMRALENGLWIYRRHFLRRWRRSLLAKAAAFPELYDFGDLTRFRTLTETTEFFVERYTEFGSLGEYLDGYALTGDALAGLDVPARLIAASDDPVIPSADLARIARSPALEITLAPAGGHCGFIENLRLGSWLDRELLAELDAL
ncbi:MAG TPA: alpha/beta fold hydrolase [Gammaproteobacteria bacterium]